MSLDKAVQPYVDQVRDGKHNRSSFGNNFKPENDAIFNSAIDAVAGDTDTHDNDEQVKALIERDGPNAVREGCRVAVINCLASNEQAGVGDAIHAIRIELQKWENAPVSKLDWFSPHILNLRKLGSHETEIVLTVRKSGGTQEIRQVVPFSIEVVEHSWEKQAKNWESVAGKESETPEVYKDERDLVFVNPDDDEELGRLRWKIIHNDPDGDTTSDDSFEYLGTE